MIRESHDFRPKRDYVFIGSIVAAVDHITDEGQSIEHEEVTRIYSDTETGHLVADRQAFEKHLAVVGE
jgi:hypothetical protein